MVLAAVVVIVETQTPNENIGNSTWNLSGRVAANERCRIGLFNEPVQREGAADLACQALRNSSRRFRTSVFASSKLR